MAKLSQETYDKIVELYQQQLGEAEQMSEKRAIFELLERLKDVRLESQWNLEEPEIVAWLEKEKSEYRK